MRKTCLSWSCAKKLDTIFSTDVARTRQHFPIESAASRNHLWSHLQAGVLCHELKINKTNSVDLHNSYIHIFYLNETNTHFSILDELRERLPVAKFGGRLCALKFWQWHVSAIHASAILHPIELRNTWGKDKTHQYLRRKNATSLRVCACVRECAYEACAAWFNYAHLWKLIKQLYTISMCVRVWACETLHTQSTFHTQTQVGPDTRAPDASAHC